MERRLILAIAASLLVMLSWSALISKTYHIENKEVTPKHDTSVTTTPTENKPINIEQQFPPDALYKYSNDQFEVTFIEPLAAIREVKFKAHQDYLFPLKYGFLLGDKELLFKRDSSAANEVVFVYSDQYKKIIKKFIFSKPSYTIELRIIVENLSSAPIPVKLPLIIGASDLSPRNKQASYQDITVATKDKASHFTLRKNLDFQEAQFLSLRDKYFCSIIEPELPNSTGFLRKVSPEESEAGLNLQEVTLAPGQKTEQKFHIYLGPQDLRLISGIKSNWSAVIHYGTFDFIAQILLQLLEFLNKVLHNWGLAIVMLSLLVYLLLFPLSLKQIRSMKEMQILQPKVEELRKAYKDNPQKLNKEIMELYRQHHVNPLGGCLPLVLQMPIFFALYQVLMRSVALKGAKFLWIKDLSEPDRLFSLPVSLPVLGNEINILPIIMAIGMFAQQKISMGSTSSASTEQQKMMLIIMPVMFGIIFYHMSSGLVLYWFINSALTLLNQFRINKVK